MDGTSGKFGKYTLQRRVAVGGMAEVYQGTLRGEAGFERQVAIKRILPHLAEDKLLVDMFIEEAKLVVRLNHPNIAQILDLGCVEASYFIAMEYVHGKDVRAIQKLQEKRGEPLALHLAVHVAMKIADALHHAHTAKDQSGRALSIIHRDVSPHNVLISYDGAVKVIDFGLAKVAGRAAQTQAGIIKGKLAYMSPEQASAKKIDCRSDVYSLGICLFELLTNKRLFLRGTDLDTVRAVQEGKIPPLRKLAPHVPEELEHVVLGALQRDPRDRYQSAMELYDQLEEFLYSTGIRAGTTEMAAYMRAAFPKEVAASKDARGSSPSHARAMRASTPGRRARQEEPPSGESLADQALLESIEASALDSLEASVLEGSVTHPKAIETSHEAFPLVVRKRNKRNPR